MKWLLSDNVLSNNILLLLWVSLMASSFVVSADLIPYANSIASTGLRFFLASMMMIPIVMANNKSAHSKFKGSRDVYVQYSFISLFLVLFFVGLFEALKTTTAMRTSVIYTLVPLLSVFLTYFWLKLETSKTKLIGFLLGTIGAVWVLLAFNKSDASLFTWSIGDGIFLVACLSLSVHVVLVKKWGSDVPPIQGSFYILSLGSVMLLPLMIVFGELDKVAWHNNEFWNTLLYLTVFTTMATFFLQQYLVQKVGPNQLLAFTYLIPILVVIPQGWAVGAQLIDGASGILITLLALYLISKEQKVIP
jgi:drug/metabolite transporter (DMT)-like permease